MDFYWLHCTGPDGPCVLFAVHDTRTDSYDLIDDGRTATPREFEGEVWLHKWRVIRKEPIVRPRFRREA